MAGIQLTGADMSGAMLTATVEELNVPVFIDEYLPPSTSTTTTTAATSINYSPTSSNNNNGNEVFKDDDERPEDFDFDINMFMSVSELTSHSNMNNSNSNSDNNNTMHYSSSASSIKDAIPDDWVQWLDMCADTAAIWNYGEDLDQLPGECEQSVDISAIANPGLQSLLNDPMFSDAAINSNSQVNSQILIADAHPIVPDITDYEELSSATMYVASPRMAEKRMKLHLNMSELLPLDPQDLDTPGVVTNVAELQEKMNLVPSYSGSVAFIEQKLIDETSNSSRLDDNDDVPPYTPQSCFSSCTNYTNPTTDFNTSPNSPALSTTSTTTTNRRKRGRPCKEHSDQPDPYKLSKLSEAEQKRLRERAKNNEASRVSRRKNKEREEAEKQEEFLLLQRNSELISQKNNWTAMETKLKRALKQQIATVEGLTAAV